MAMMMVLRRSRRSSGRCPGRARCSTPAFPPPVHKVARETVTLDLLSGGRLVFGAGLGVTGNNELEPFGEVTEPRERARLLDAGLDALARSRTSAWSPPRRGSGQ